jgi:hypothetical protein
MTHKDELGRSEASPLAADVGERVTAVLRAAEEAATAIRRQAEEQVQARRREAEAEIVRYTEAKTREADELLASRLRRIADVSDALVQRGEALVAQLGGAEELRRSLEAAVRAIAEAAERLARDVSSAERPSLSVVRPGDAPEQPTQVTASPEPAEGPAEPPRPAREEPEMSPLERLKAAGGPPEGERPEVERRGRFTHPPAGDPPTPLEDKLLGARLVALQMAVAGSDRDEVERHLRSEFDLEDPSSVLDEVFGRVSKG